MYKFTRAPGAELRHDMMRDMPWAWRFGRKRVAVAVLLGLSTAAGAQTSTAMDELPDAPSALMSQAAADGSDAQKPTVSHVVVLRPCNDSDYVMEKIPLQGPPPCIPENPISPYVTSAYVKPLNSHQKGTLAMRDFLDPFNFITIAGYSGIAVAANSHSAYGSGFGGWAKLTGYGLAEDAQGEFLETYAIASLVHEDPRYHRMPSGSMKRRMWHAVKHTYVSQHDDGRRMPNYATLLMYPISAALSNLYVPGIPTDAASTAGRVAIGIAADPAGAIVAEFLPDVAKHIHIHVQFAQELIDRAVTGAPNTE